MFKNPVQDMFNKSRIALGIAFAVLAFAAPTFLIAAYAWLRPMSLTAQAYAYGETAVQLGIVALLVLLPAYATIQQKGHFRFAAAVLLLAVTGFAVSLRIDSYLSIGLIFRNGVIWFLFGVACFLMILSSLLGVVTRRSLLANNTVALAFEVIGFLALSSVAFVYTNVPGIE